MDTKSGHFGAGDGHRSSIETPQQAADTWNQEGSNRRQCVFACTQHWAIDFNMVVDMWVRYRPFPGQDYGLPYVQLLGYSSIEAGTAQRVLNFEGTLPPRIGNGWVRIRPYGSLGAYGGDGVIDIVVDHGNDALAIDVIPMAYFGKRSHTGIEHGTLSGVLCVNQLPTEKQQHDCVLPANAVKWSEQVKHIVSNGLHIDCSSGDEMED